MKKKLFPTALALACALTCTFSLAACDLGGSNTTQTNGDITATSIEAEEVALKANVSGWKFTDSTEGDMTDRYCIDLYVYVNTTEQYSAFRYNNTDFTANGVSPDSINEVGEKKILNASYTFNDYMLDNGAPYTAKSTSTTNGNDTDGYTETWGATYHKTVSSELSRNVNYIQRYVLQFESPVVAGTIKYKNSTILKRSETDTFPSNQYTVADYNSLQMFVTDNTATKITYGMTTSNYKTPYQKEHTLTENVITLRGVKFDDSINSLNAKNFTLEAGGKTYKANGFYTGKEEKKNADVSLGDFDAEYVDGRTYRKLKCDVEKIVKNDFIGKTENFSLYFNDLEEIPETFTITFKDYSDRYHKITVG